MATLLVVEDNAHNLELMTCLLEASGHEVVASMSGHGVLELAYGHRPALVVLDIHLPDTDGYAVLEQLRADRMFADIPVLAVTAYAMVGDRDQALTAGFDGYLSKPIDPGSFVSTVNEYLPADLRGRDLPARRVPADEPVMARRTDSPLPTPPATRGPTNEAP
jgi:CheY-like chemotaxis protein